MNQKVVIVGGGIVGCMTAMEMVKRGCDVTIVERNQIASQTSGESSWAGGGILFPLLPWSYSKEVNALTLHGAKAYRTLGEQLLRETGIDVHVEQSGFLLLPKFDLAAAQDWCMFNQLAMSVVSASAFGVASPEGDSALWMPSVCQIRPPYLMQALRTWLLQHHVTLLEQTELLPLKDTQVLSQWPTVNGLVLEADQFVVTSGAWSFALLKDTAAKLNVKPMRGQILLYKPEKNLKQIVYKDDFYMIPRRDGYLLAGSTLEDVGFEAAVTQAVRDEISAKAVAMMPSLKNQPILKHWSGLRPGTPDNLPTISAHPSIKNLYLNTGHFRYGLTMAPASAKLVTAIMLGESPHMDATPYACLN